MNKKAVTYLRVARHSDKAIEQQRQACAQEAKSLGLTIMREFVDIGASGQTMERVGLRAMLDYLIEPGADVLIVPGIPRLARNLHMSRAIASQIEASGAVLVLAGHLKVQDGR
jgi:DNA invertase Pin-like site-specific DNA recombinase